MFWQKLGNGIVRFRFLLAIIVFAISGVMAYWAKQVPLSYEFSKAIPEDNLKYIAYKNFKKLFGDDGNLIIIGFQTDSLFQKNNFNKFADFCDHLKKIEDVIEVVSLSKAIKLENDVLNEKFNSINVFPDSIWQQPALDDAKKFFNTMPIYKGYMYNATSNTFLVGIKVNKDSINSNKRTVIIPAIKKLTEQFQKDLNIETHLSGLPLIRTEIAEKIQLEMKSLLLYSLALSAILLLLFFRSISTTLLSLIVVLIGVAFSFGLMHLLGYKITLLSALIPPLVVVIGIPNCIYFINKYHSSIDKGVEKIQALKDMIGKMGVVTLFCNISAAIGFFVFAKTESALLKEFGWVAGFAIMFLFFISLIVLPAGLSILPKPKAFQLSYLKSKIINSILKGIEILIFKRAYIVWIFFLGLLAVSFVGITKLKSQAFMLDDIPKTDKIYTDLKFLETNFKGIMPLEIVIDAKKPKALAGAQALKTFGKIDTFSNFIFSIPEMGKPLSLVEGLKFAKQGFYGDSTSYSLPVEQDLLLMAPYLKAKKDSAGKNNTMSKLLNNFIDSSKSITRISCGMADVGTNKLDSLLKNIESKAKEIFPDSSYKVELTGTSVTFLEGSKFIIKGLKESILFAFALIAICMLYLFKSLRILICSLIPNLIPLICTAGLMGWVGVPLKPSTVLVFSVALGIAIDITIRFLVFYKQEKNIGNNDELIKQTLYQTGPSIIFTSIVLIGGFVVFCKSNFGGTFALGWLTSFTLIVATLTNLILLPTLLRFLGFKFKK